MERQHARITLLDELRGLCLVLMVFYHAFYTLGMLLNATWALKLLYFFTPAEPLFAGIFILLCGFSCRLSRSNLRRGALLLLVALAMSLVLWLLMPDQMIWFGILHCLAVCILLFCALRPLLDRCPPLVGAIVCAVLFLLTWHFPVYEGAQLGIPPLSISLPSAWRAAWWLYPLGIGEAWGADYFPLIPWLFCFLCGSFLGCFRDRLPAFCYTPHLPPLAFLGRHSLLIYLVHQPIIYGIGMAATALLS